jgi:hypothetical protein
LVFVFSTSILTPCKAVLEGRGFRPIFFDEAEEVLKKCHSLLGIVKWDGNLLDALGVRLC